MDESTLDPRLDAIVDCLYRVTVKAVIIHDSKLLVVKEVSQWYGLPGGGLDYGEDLVDALRREICEEITTPVDNIDIDASVLFMTNNSTLKGIPRLHIYYRAMLHDTQQVSRNELDHRWVTGTEFNDIYFSPALQPAKARLAELLNRS